MFKLMIAMFSMFILIVIMQALHTVAALMQANGALGG